MVYFERFLLSQLKDIIRLLKIKFNIINYHKIYLLNKYDIIVILRNSGYFIENNDVNYLLFKYKKHKIKFYPSYNKRYYRGEKIENGLEKVYKKIILNFD